MPIAKKNDIPQDFLDQMKNNLTKGTVQDSASRQPASLQVEESVTETTVTAVKAAVPQAAAVPTPEPEKKEKYADVMNVRLSKGRRNEIKAFCSSCGVSVTQYIESSFEYLSKEVAAGRIVISKGGITRVEQ